MAAHESWSIAIDKDYLKFSAAHFLIFPDGSAERLHGHNYKVYVDVHTELDAHGLVLNFQEIKPMVRELCDELDEHLLLPGEHPVLTATRDGEHYDVRYRDRRYLVPVADVLILPIGNTSAENLAAWFGRTLRQRITSRWPDLVLRMLVVGVEEAPGQRGVWTLRERD
jgi:6-pyruvoyltetrahydropterin/6-carboxytetrahydropterin synthase